MPETTKLDRHEEGFFAMGEPGAGVKNLHARTEAGHPVSDEKQTQEGGAAAPGDEDHIEPIAEVPDGDAEGIDEFAESVVSGLEQLEAEAHEDTLEAVDASSSGETGTDEAFFSGWGSEAAAEELTITPPPHERPLPSQQTLSEIGLASAAQFAAVYPSAIDGASNKHDELAEAVQSALLSVYGDPSAQVSLSAPRAAEFSHESLAAGGADPEAMVVANPRMSPQDVILNYFDYNPGAPGGQGFASGRDAGGRLPSGAEHLYQQPTAYSQYPGQQQPRRAGDHQDRAPYEVPALFPMPLEANPPQKTGGARTERENSRLLGAAAIGLVGGIAMAVTLAVFVISSYGPDLRVSPGGYRTSEGADPGYGGVERDVVVSEPKKIAAITPPQPESEIVAADATATPGQPAPLTISVKSQRPFEQTLVSISGLPEGGRLNAGIDAGGGNWLLPPRRLNGLTVNLPNGGPNILPLEAQLLDSNARTPLSAKTQFAIRVNSFAPETTAAVSNTQSMMPSAEAAPLAFGPSQTTAPANSFNAQTVATPPSAPQRPSIETNFRTQTVAAPAPRQGGAPQFEASLVPVSPASPQSAPQTSTRKLGPQPEIEDLIREGNKRMKEGDILEARRFYQKAVMLGDPEAALAMGRSYDPIYFARIDKKNAEPDAAKAFDWYRRAMDGGAAQTAKVRIENLKHFLNE